MTTGGMRRNFRGRFEYIWTPRVQTHMHPQTSFADLIRQHRELQGLPLRVVAEKLKVDTSLVSKWECGERKPIREDIDKLAKVLKCDGRALLVAWLRDAVVYTAGEDEIGLEVLKAAEAEVAYRLFSRQDRGATIRKLKRGLAEFPKVRKAWLFGSFARKDDKPGSDIDLAIEVEEPFSYFDLADVQHQLEALVARKVDVGFLDSFRPHVLQTITPDLQLIHAR